MRTFRSGPLVLAAVIVGLVLRLAFGLLYWNDKPLTQDEREYLALATSLAEGRGFTYPDSYDTGTGQRFARAPGYPVFLRALGARSASSTPVRVKVAQSVLGALVVWLIAALAARAGGPTAGVAAATIAAIYPPLVWLPSYVFSEALYMPMALGCVLLLDRALGRPETRQRGEWMNALVLAAGVTAGAATLVRSAMLLFLPLAALWMLRRRQLPLALAFCVTALLIVAPWTLRNVRVHGRPIVVAADGGVTFWTGNHPLARGEGDLAANPALKAAEIAFRQQHPGLPPEQLEPVYYSDALAYIRQNPGWWFGLVARKAFYTIMPIGPSYTLHSTRYLMATVIAYGLIAPLGLAGLTRLVRSGRLSPLLLLALSVVATALIFFPQERFRIPVIDPLLIISASLMLAGAPTKR